MSPLNVQATLQAAIARHQAGQLAEAEALYRQILEGQPRHPDALHLLGLLAHHRGQNEAAVELMGQALQVAPNHAPCHTNLGTALLALGRLPEAVASYRRALAIDRQFAEAHLGLGNAYQQQGQADEAIASYRRVLQFRPQFAEAHYNLGRVYAGAGKLEDATRSYRKAAALRPDYAEAHFNLGNVLQALGQTDDAIASYRNAVALRPDYADAHNNLGAQLEAAGRPDEARASYQQALALAPEVPEAHNNLGNVLLAEGRLDEAMGSYRAALELRPGYLAALNNLANALQAAGRLDEAIAIYDGMLAREPGSPGAEWNKAFALLLKGDYAAGWPLFESRWQVQGRHPDQPALAQPLWLGAPPVAGQTVLVHHEQGLGDTLQMLRYVPLLADRGARVILQVPPPLATLAATVRGVSTVVTGDTLPAFDLHCPCMSLPLAFGTTLATIPASVPYLAVPDANRTTWHARLGGRTRQRVGLAWSGSTTHKNDRQRSLPLQPLLAALDDRHEWHSLQKDYRAGDLERLVSDGRVRDWSVELGDLADTAGLIAQLDLVITVDTSVAHLAGALGKPVWVLLPFGPDYRWLLERTDSPWYPTARLFRQPAPGDWAAVLAAVGHALAAA